MNTSPWTLFYIAFLLCSHNAKAHEESVTSSVAGMQKLVLLEAKLIESLRSYTNELEAKLRVLQSAIPYLEAEKDQALTQMERYASNPIKAFSLVRRMHEDWDEWRVFVATAVGHSHIKYMNDQRHFFTTSADVYEAAQSIHRLQETYLLPTKDFARGMVNGKQYNASFNAFDSYTIGRIVLKTDRELAREWFAETRDWLMEGHALPTPLGAKRERISHYIAEAIFNYKFYCIALPIFDYAMQLGNKTEDPTLLSKRMEIEKLAQEEAVRARAVKKEPTSYERGCRGEFDMQSNLICLYKSRGSAFLRLAPIKVEAVHLDPLIVVFHDILSDREMEELQRMAEPHLERTTVMHKSGVDIVQNIRTSKGTWVERDENNLTLRIERRIMDMVDLELEGSEQLQIMNYGIGGHFSPHHDYFIESDARESEEGNRMATVLFYLSDVEQGGATAFPILKLAVWPKRGTALFWYNLLNNGSVDPRTLHGGCPVLLGSKWMKGIMKLALIESKLIESLRSYANEMEEKLRVLQRWVESLEARGEQANWEQYNASFNAFDSYTIGRIVLKTDRELAREWFAETRGWLMEGHALPTPLGAKRDRISHYIAETIFNYKLYSIALPYIIDPFAVIRQT